MALLSIGMALTAVAVRAEAPTATEVSATTPPIMCVYRGPAPFGPRDNNAPFAQWLGLPAVWGEDFQANEDWNNVEGVGWQLGPWGEWKKAISGRRLVLTISILPGAWNLSGPKRGIDAGTSVSWAAGARGDYNLHFKKLAENLVKSGLGDSLLRLGHEMNGGWYTWRAKGHEEEFAAYWRQIVKTMRAVPKTQFEFVFNPTQGYQQCDSTKAWPGDEYVDYVGLDAYDQSWLAGTYPIPKDATPQDISARRKKVWDELLNGNHGLVFWRNFAKVHHTKFSIPEWGVWVPNDGHGGGDDPEFIERMHKYIMNPDNGVVWHCYFDITSGGEAHHQLSPGPKGTYVTDLPQSAAKFKELFGADGEKPTTKTNAGAQ